LFNIFSQFVPLEKSFRATKPNFAFHLMNTSLIVGNGVLLFTILRQTKNKLKKNGREHNTRRLGRAEPEIPTLPDR
jgi:hypothetical protein